MLVKYMQSWYLEWGTKKMLFYDSATDISFLFFFLSLNNFYDIFRSTCAEGPKLGMYICRSTRHTSVPSACTTVLYANVTWWNSDQVGLWVLSMMSSWLCPWITFLLSNENTLPSSFRVCNLRKAYTQSEVLAAGLLKSYDELSHKMLTYSPKKMVTCFTENKAYRCSFKRVRWLAM